MHEVLYSKASESSVLSARPRGPAWTKTSGVENVSDLCVKMVVEQLVDELHDLRWRLHLLPRRFRIHGGERCGVPALEADVDPGCSFVLSTASSKRAIPAQNAAYGQNCAPFWAS